MEQREQSFSEHLGELRRRIVWMVFTFFVTLIVGFIFAMDIFHWIRETTFSDLAINAFSPSDSIKVYMQISFIIAFVITSPVILYHIWQFVRPGLHPKEQKATLLYIPASVLLFICGLSFGYFAVFPFLIQFMTSINEQMGIVEVYGVYQAFGFLLNIVFPIALFFELPVVVLFLTSLGILKPIYLIKARRYAYLLMVIIAAVISPPDFVSNILVAIPLILLYEVSIWLSTWLYHRMEKRNQMNQLEDEN
ncbi:twin-arginine translocase subunit TatC [Hazenella coriacea]|uniref:Sec-independent protein translocase protein TatC n=1 Tax=Hazenella coriacea TaxID=1179467 RepID=A0A4R3L1L2_9BACL|nr:twin-arginine translocase subunit TatC [Hazenella coriacea]TCS93289.1 sec-independent protein translocase protein TatC [Hazenella coriacea]